MDVRRRVSLSARGRAGNPTRQTYVPPNLSGCEMIGVDLRRCVKARKVVERESVNSETQVQQQEIWGLTCVSMIRTTLYPISLTNAIMPFAVVVSTLPDAGS